jgi:hypothetical protein
MFLFVLFGLIIAYSRNDCLNAAYKCSEQCDCDDSSDRSCYKNCFNCMTKFTMVSDDCFELIFPNWKQTKNSNKMNVTNDIVGCSGATSKITCWRCNSACTADNCFCENGICTVMSNSNICCNPGQSASCYCSYCTASCSCS